MQFSVWKEAMREVRGEILDVRCLEAFASFLQPQTSNKIPKIGTVPGERGHFPDEN